MTISELKKGAREALTGKWGKGAGIVGIYVLISLVMGFISGLFEEGTLIVTLLSIVELIITVPLNFGLGFAFLKLKRGEDVDTFDFWNLGFTNFSRAWAVTGRMLLKLILPIIAIIAAAIIYTFALTASIFTGEGLVFIFGIGILIIAFIYYISVALSYSLTTYLAYDNEELTAAQIVNESARLMRGNKLKIILLELSFIGWIILGILTLGIGYLWLSAYMQVALICFYDNLVQVKEDKINEVDNPIQEQ